jgi:hypothetical protein
MVLNDIMLFYTLLIYINVCGIERFDLGKICVIKEYKCAVMNDSLKCDLVNTLKGSKDQKFCVFFKITGKKNKKIKSRKTCR